MNEKHIESVSYPQIANTVEIVPGLFLPMESAQLLVAILASVVLTPFYVTWRLGHERQADDKKAKRNYELYGQYK